MNRNLNLEEINSDAFMGISYLNHQSVLQKGIFIISIIAAVAVMLTGTFLIHWNVNVSALLSLLPLLFGVAFGCNYNQDLSLFQFVRLMICKPSRTYITRSTEDVEYLRNIEDRIKQEEEINARLEQKASPEEQKKVLIILVLTIVCIIVVFMIITMVIKGARVDEIHHTISFKGRDWRHVA